MFERFTDRARKVMALANEQAARFNHEYIGTEHMLLGLIQEGQGVGANVLKNLGMDLDKARVEVEKLFKSGPVVVPRGKLPQTPLAKRAIEYAIAEARSLNHDYVGTEHLLPGLLREHEGVAAKVLTNLGINLEVVREEVLKLLGAPGQREDEDRHTGASSMPISPEAFDLFAKANEEAAAMSRPTVLPEHVLLALLKDPSSRTGKILVDAGLDLDVLRKRLGSV